MLHYGHFWRTALIELGNSVAADMNSTHYLIWIKFLPVSATGLITLLKVENA